MHYDALIIGAGPAGLSAAIRLKQIALKDNKEISVCIVEKGVEVGAHILSGNVFETVALDELFPDWRDDPDVPISTKASDDSFKILTSDKNYFTIPSILHPPELHNKGNYIISLSQLVRWLGNKAEELGVEIYPGFAASEVLYCV
jgi:electron-transferring-flavoprotein dehydrogenase